MGMEKNRLHQLNETHRYSNRPHPLLRERVRCQMEKVFSWGRGQDGRLGHGDYKDRWEPCRVSGLGQEPVALIAAGTAHSMAVSLPQSVHVWGRG